MSLTVILAATAVGLALPVLFWGLAGGAGARQAVAANLSRGLAAGADLRQIALTGPASERAVTPLLQRLARLGRSLTPAAWVTALERRLALAGQPAAWPLERLLAVKLLLGAAAAALGVLRLAAAPGLLSLLLVVAATLGAAFLPDVLLVRRGRRRQAEIQLALPDTLDQMTICVQAGLGFEGAMARAARTGHGAVADEFRRTLQEMHIGATRGQALRQLQRRTDVPELRRFVLALTQAESYGLPIAEVLRVQAADLRLKRKQRAEERAMKLPVKIVFPLVLCILPCLMVVVLGPAAIRLARFFSGT